MMKKESDRTILILLFVTVFLIAIIILSLNIIRSLDSPATCNQCHEIKQYENKYEPGTGSVIALHNLTCIECHTNTSRQLARDTILKKIELSALARMTGSTFKFPSSALAANCTRCHLSHYLISMNTPNTSKCLDCHWSHKPTKVSNLDDNRITYGPHKNQSCEDCHGKNFVKPRCINCHAGHGEQKLENELCLACHMEPHVPKIPGIKPNNTVKFLLNLSFSVCSPCHEKEYLELITSGSLHIEMQTCVICHDSHGRIPKCEYCHEAMKVKPHLKLQCGDCHIPSSVGSAKIPCMNCHGRTHDWSSMTAIIGSKD